MKILKLEIIDPQSKLVRSISFKKTGVSYIYGDIQDPTNLGATINSLGKTLLLKCIDYIFGANEDSNIIKEAIHKYKLRALVLNEGKEYIVHRTLGDSDTIYIDNQHYTLTEYRDYFGIERRLYGKQFILRKKASEISYRTYPNKDDVVSVLDLLGLSKILEKINEIYESQDRIKSLKKNKKDLVEFYGDFDEKQIDEEIYFIDKEVEKVTTELRSISSKIKKIEISEVQKNIIEEYANKSKELKDLKSKYERNRLENERLNEFIDNSNKVDISSNQILAIFRKAEQEVPELVKRSIEEAEAFHKKVFDERKEFLTQKKYSIQENMISLRADIELLSEEVDKIGSIISLNEVYQESIELYEKYNSELHELKYKQGRLSQVKSIDDAIDKEEILLMSNFTDANQIRKSYEKVIQKYRDFIFKITQAIYDNDVNSYFDIKIRPKHLSHRPIIFEFTLKGDTGEGVSEVKKNLIDFLICRYNTYMEMMIQDSACFNGIDPRQVAGMLLKLNEIAEDSNKQVIVAINKYQIGSYSETIKMVEENSVITLSEKDNLLGIDF